MKIALDAMGGDRAPSAIIEGAVKASRELNVDIILVGVEDIIKEELKRLNDRSSKIEIVHSPEVIKMEESVFQALRLKKSSSIKKAVQLVKEGNANGVVSAGNTGAVMALSKAILGPVEGVERPALAIIVPTLKGFSILMDVGANVDCKPRHLKQFALMGKIFMEQIFGKENPKIGLVNIGEEEGKGNELIKETFKELRNSNLNFIGNIEGRAIYQGVADVIISDGFTGNVALKVTEGVVEVLFSMLKGEVSRNLIAKLGFLLMNRALKKFKKKVDYSEYGGGLLLGINGVAVIGHGRSGPEAIKNAIRVAKNFIYRKVQERISFEILKLKEDFRKI
ncbi:MAG: phosphate acyltransferase PlsX [Acidobacteriota bacterium]